MDDVAVGRRGGRPLRIAVAGADHLHLFELVDRMLAAGAETVAHTPCGDLVGVYEDWRTESISTSLESILGDADIDLVVTAAVPSRRAAVAVAAIDAGKDVLSDKPGVTTRSQLDELAAVCAGRPGRPWTVLFTERFENRAIAEAVRLARDGAVGRVVHVIGAGPHSMFADRRPAWFWDPEATGGILVDIGSHQVDQFVAIAETAITETPTTSDDRAASGARSRFGVAAAAVGNVASPGRPRMQDIATMTLTGPGVVGDHRLDYLTADGLGTWGDVRLTIVGTEGTIEARANVDVGGAAGAEHLIVVDGDGARRVDVSDVGICWADQLVDDVFERSETLMTQEHVFTVTDLCLQAQEMARQWGTAVSRW